MKSQFFLICILMLLVGCNETDTVSQNSSPSSSASPITPSPSQNSSPSSSASPITASPSAQSSTLTKPASAAMTITPGGIGEAKLGMTLGELKQKLGANAEFKVQSDFMVDFAAIGVSQSGKVQYYIIYPAVTPLTDSDIIQDLLTENPDFKTAEGIGTGTPLKDAEAAYGDATLSYNPDSEGREYVRFAEQPTKNFNFRLSGGGGGNLAGIYPPGSERDGSKLTKEYRQNATIRGVEVRCVPLDQCPKP